MLGTIHLSQADATTNTRSRDIQVYGSIGIGVTIWCWMA